MKYEQQYKFQVLFNTTENPEITSNEGNQDQTKTCGHPGQANNLASFKPILFK
jgi:hypothetical protein